MTTKLLILVALIPILLLIPTNVLGGNNTTHDAVSLITKRSTTKLSLISEDIQTKYDQIRDRGMILNDSRMQMVGISGSSLIQCINSLVTNNGSQPITWCDTNLSYEYSQHYFQPANMTDLAKEYLHERGIL